MKREELQGAFKAGIALLESSLKDAPLEHVVEVGHTLAEMVSEASHVLEDTKVRLREEALESLGHKAGSVSFQGTGQGWVTVTVPQPVLRLTKGVDPESLKVSLGKDFDLYFDTKVTYTPRKTVGGLIVKLASGTTRSVLLSSIEEKESTPRVSFKRP